jgi:hypothetical protein
MGLYRYYVLFLRSNRRKKYEKAPIFRHFAHMALFSSLSVHAALQASSWRYVREKIDKTSLLI